MGGISIAPAAADRDECAMTEEWFLQGVVSSQLRSASRASRRRVARKGRGSRRVVRCRMDQLGQCVTTHLALRSIPRPGQSSAANDPHGNSFVIRDPLCQGLRDQGQLPCCRTSCLAF